MIVSLQGCFFELSVSLQGYLFALFVSLHRMLNNPTTHEYLHPDSYPVAR